MVEHAAHNRGVAGSIPATATTAAGAIVASGLIPGSAHILAAVSGGSDSTALLMGLQELGVRTTVAHFDHALRSESADESEHVRVLCSRLDVPLVYDRRNTPLGRGSAEAAARRHRYDFLARAHRSARTDLVALAHTADDRVEGVLLHLLRGSGLAGARGMPVRRGPFVRPLLGAWRTDLQEDLRRLGLAWLEDRSNLDASRARTRVRLQLLPALERDRPGLKARLLRVAQRCEVMYAELEGQAARLHTGATADPLRLSGAPRGIRVEALRRMFVAAGGIEPGLSRRHFEAMEHVVRARRGHVDLPGRIAFEVGGEQARARGPADPETE